MATRDYAHAGIVYGLQFGPSRTVTDSWELASRVLAPPADNARGFGSALLVGRFGPEPAYRSLAVSSPLADYDGVEDLGIVEVFDGQTTSSGDPPFDVGTGAQLLLAPAQIYRERGARFGHSLSAGPYSGESGLDMAVSAPGTTNGSGVVSVLFDVPDLPRATAAVDPSLTWAQDQGAAEIPGATIDLSSEMLPESDDEYGASLGDVNWSPLFTRIERVTPVAQTGQRFQPLLVGAPGEGLGTNPNVGTVCLVDLSAPDSLRQWCFDPENAAGLPLRAGMRWGESVQGAWLGPVPIGLEPGYTAFQVVGGAPRWWDDPATMEPIGAVGMVWVSMAEDQPIVEQHSAPLQGNFALETKSGPAGGPLRYGAALATLDLSGQGIYDLVATAPASGSGAGGVTWTSAQFSSPPSTGTSPGFYQWQKTPEDPQWGWADDTIDFFLADLSGRPVVELALWSESNYGLLMSAVGQCSESNLNVLNTTEFIRNRSANLGWGGSGAGFESCDGSPGAFTGATIEPDELCSDDSPPDPLEVGDPYSRPFYSHAPIDGCGWSPELQPPTGQRRRVAIAVPRFEDRGFPVEVVMELTGVMNVNVNAAPVGAPDDGPDAPFAIADFYLLLSSDGLDTPEEITISMTTNILPGNLEDLLRINNRQVPNTFDEDPDDPPFEFVLQRTSDFTCE